MARIAGVDIPRDKKVDVSLTYIYGIGPNVSRRILAEAGIDTEIKVKDLKDSEVSKIREIIDKEYKVGDISLIPFSNTKDNEKLDEFSIEQIKSVAKSFKARKVASILEKS